MSNSLKSLDVSVSSDERKRKHGNTAPYGPDAQGKTYIGGNSLSTCTQGSTPANGQWSPGIRRPTDHPPGMPGQWPPPATCPVDKKTYLTDRACRPPGMPGHWPPVTRHSPTTGQVGDIETSSLLITGHRPSSHRSLDSERLNTGEIQES